jgi:vitamin B12 transporter
VRAISLNSIMKTLKPCAHWVLSALACAAVSSSLAQQNALLPPVIVTATRSEMPLPNVLADVSVLDRTDIERSGAVSVAEVLSRVPGISISQTGGPTSTTGVFIRGAESRFTAVFIDGVRIDSQSTGGATYEAIPLSQVDRIEVLRGPAAAVYGSDAVAGVVQIFTRRGEQGFHPSVTTGIGNYNTHDTGVSLRGADGSVDYAIGLADTGSQGFNAIPAGTNSDRDGFRNRSFSGRLGWKIQPDQKLELTLLDNQQKTQYDGYGSAPPTNDIAKSRLQTFGLNWNSQWEDNWSTRFALTRSTDRFETTPSVYATETHTTTYLVRNQFNVGSGLLAADLERREDNLQNSDTTPSVNTKRSQDAVALGYGAQFGVHSLQANARHDNDSEFGGNTIGSIAYGYEISPTLRATASTGTAFRVPTLFQRFSIYGTSTLKAETSNNNEVGLRWLSGVDRASLVVYQNDIENLINYVSGAGSCINGTGAFAGCYGNTGHARITGATIAGGTRVENINLAASLDVMDPMNVDTNAYLARRARQQASFTADMPLGEWNVGAQLQYVGKRFDNASNSVSLDPYSLINLTASRAIDRDWRVLARVNNLANTSYAFANGYATAGRTFYVGLIWAPKK